MPIYTYQQLKGRIKVGDTVKRGRRLEKVTAVTDKCFWLGEGAMPLYFRANASLELLEEKTLDTVDVGDVVVGTSGDERTILDTSKNGIVLFLSSYASKVSFWGAHTRHDLKRMGFTVKNSPIPLTPTEMTREEAEKELSKDGKIVKIV